MDQNDLIQSQNINSQLANLNNVVSGSNLPDSAPAQHAKPDFRPSVPQGGDSDYVRMGTKMIFKDSDLVSAATRSIDTLHHVSAQNGYRPGYSPNINLDKYVMPENLTNLSRDQMMGMAERLCEKEKNIPGQMGFAGKDHVVNGVSHKYLSGDGKVLNVFRSGYMDAVQNGGTMHLSKEQADTLRSSSETKWGNAITQDNTITLTDEQFGALDRHMRWQQKHDDYLDKASTHINTMSQRMKQYQDDPFMKLSSRDRDSAVFVETLSDSKRRYDDAFAKLYRAKADLRTASTSEAKDLAKKALSKAKGDLNSVLKDAEGRFVDPELAGKSGHQGRMDFAFRVVEHGLNDESGSDFTAREARSALMKGRGAYMTAKGAIRAGREIHIKAIDNQIKKTTDPILRSELMKKKNDLLKIKEKRAQYERVKGSLHIKDALKAKDDLINAKALYDTEKLYKNTRKRKDDLKKLTDKHIRHQKKIRDTKKRAIRDVKTKEKKLLENKALKEQRRKRSINDALFDKKKKKGLAAAITRRKAKDAAKKTAGKAAGKIGLRALFKKGGIKGFFIKFFLIIILLVIILIILLVTQIVTGAVYMVYEMFSGDDSEQELDGTELQTKNYQEVIRNLRQWDISWQDDVGYDAKAALEKRADEIKQDMIDAGANLQYSFPVRICKGETGLMIDEYGKPRVSMGNYVPNLIMSKYRVNTDLKSDEDTHPADVNMPQVLTYIAYLWGGDPNSDSANWTGRYSEDVDHENDLGTDRNGQNPVKGEPDEDTRWSKPYSYQNWDPAATHWIGENRRVKDTAVSLTYQKDAAAETGVLTKVLNGEWLDDKEVALHFWHHDESDLLGCDAVQHHPTSQDAPYMDSTGHQCNNYHTEDGGSETTYSYSEDINGDGKIEGSERGVSGVSKNEAANAVVENMRDKGGHSEISKGTTANEILNDKSGKYSQSLKDELGQKVNGDDEHDSEIGSEEVHHIDYICDGHCPGHIVPIIDYEFIGNMDNLAAFDVYPINQTKSVSDRWDHWWKSKGVDAETVLTVLGIFYKYNMKGQTIGTIGSAVNSIENNLKMLNMMSELSKLQTQEERDEWFEDHPDMAQMYEDYKGLGEHMKDVRQECLDMSGESSWDHWNVDDMKWLHETGGEYSNGYADGREYLEEWNIHLGELAGGGMTDAQKTALLEEYGLTLSDIVGDPGGHNPAATTHAIQEAIKLAETDLTYVWGGTNPNYGMDCSGFACWFTAVYMHPDEDPMSLTSYDSIFGTYFNTESLIAVSDPLVSSNQIKPGSILVWRHGGHGHTVVCVGTDGNGNFLIAEENGDEIDAEVWWKSWSDIVYGMGMTHIYNGCT